MAAHQADLAAHWLPSSKIVASGSPDIMHDVVMLIPVSGATEAQTGTAVPNASAFPGLAKLFGTGATPAAPIGPSGLKPIKTPHLEPISHPELAFSPSDIGVWEINKSAHPLLI